MDFEEGEGVTSRSNSLFFLFYLILRFCNVWYKPNFQNLTGIVGSGGKCTIFLIKTYFANPPQNFCFSRMVTEGFDDERENVDEL